MQNKDKKSKDDKKDLKEVSENAPKTPQEIKKIIEKNRYGGYYKTKKRFIN